jgi:hypothetical protein
MRVVSRKEARAKDLLHYFTGKPCKRGHVSARFTENKTCVECDLLRHRNNPAHAARCRVYYRGHRKKLIAQVEAYNEAHPEERRIWQARYRRNAAH